MHSAQMNYKLVGSYALKCGCSHYGFRVIGYHAPVVQFVFIFKRKDKAQNFSGWLKAGGLRFDRDFSFQHRYHKGQFIYLVILNSILFVKAGLHKVKKGLINVTKFYYKNFPQFCRQNVVSLYQSNQTHLYHN